MALETRIDGVLFEQASPSLTWTITHNLGTLAPAVDVWVLDGPNTVKILADSVTAIDVNTVEITFTTAKSGKAMVV